MTSDQKRLLKTWREELGAIMHTHGRLSVKIRRLNYFLGVPMIVIAMVIASYVFFTINQNPVFWVKMLVGMLALLTAILASLQTFLKYSEQAENHRNAAARYQALYNSLDQLLAIPPKNEHALEEWCDHLRERWDALNLEAPSVSRTTETAAAPEKAAHAVPAEEPEIVPEEPRLPSE